ncbi:acyl-CoA dehydrogenase family protein [Nocardiopsis baichengensis]|uniref:acyl-CoA dehydrogenase family protein n=1 Tax=Nocardiopsis baichengensis TaxID=280240 RepID=UPI0005940644|nr:acyl-CoA dehydrogenase [Nocardiopsis baichengensis]
MRLRAEHAELRDTVRRLLARHRGAAAWRPLAEQVGASGLAVPEHLGGGGFGPLEVHVVMEELGRALAETPFLSSSVLAGQALVQCGPSPLRDAWLGRLAEGTATAALAWAEDGGFDPTGLTARAEPANTSRPGAGEGPWRVTGRKRHVLGAGDADLLVVAASTADGPAVFAVDPRAEGVSVAEHVPVDLTRPQADTVLDGAPAHALSLSGERILWDVLTAACTALSAEQVGGAARCVEMTVAYAGTREQFGRPIGSFQAVKHRLADMYVALESARSLSYAAAFALDDGSPEAWIDASAAKAACSEAYRAIAGEAIQLHGGIGVTWEHDAQRHFKRAHGSALLFGTPEWHRRRLAPVLGLDAVAPPP